MELNFVASRGPEKASPSILRRQKLLRRIDQQIKFVRDMIGGEVRRASWVWIDEQGTYFVPIKYGRFSLELKKGMFSVQCKDLDECEHVLCTFRTMILAGEFDDHLAKASTEIRKKFGK